MTKPTPKKPGKAEKWAARGERLSAALRENLKRRKAQARERSKEEPAKEELSRQDGAGGPGPGPGEAVDAAAKAGPAAPPEFRRNPGGD